MRHDQKDSYPNSILLFEMYNRETFTEEGRILKVTAYVFFLTLFTKALQIIFFPLVAAFFGTSGEFESFIVAWSISTFVSTALLGNFGTAFIFIFAEQKVKYGDEAAWDFASSLINIVLLGAVGITVVGILLSPWLVHLLVPGMESVYQHLGARLTQILFITVVLFAWMIILAAILQSHQSFIVPAAATLFGNVVLIATMLVLKQRIGIYLLPLASILAYGSAVVMLLMASKALWWGRYSFKLNAEQSIIKEALLMFLGVSVIGALWQINLIINRFFASLLPTGSIATLEYASRSVFLIVELLSLSVVVPLYQRMSSESAMGDQGKVRDTFSLGVKITAVLLFPIATFVILFRAPIFQVFLEYGKFTAQNTIQVSSVFLYLSISMIGSGFGQMIVCTYCVLRKVRVLLIVSFCGLILNILLSGVLHRVMGVEGLALATGIATLLGSIFSFGLLNKEMGGLDVVYLAKFTLKSFLAAVLSGISVWLLFLCMDHWMKMDFLSQIIKLGTSAVVFTAIYLFLMSLFRMGEINLILNIIKDRFRIMSRAQPL